MKKLSLPTLKNFALINFGTLLMAIGIYFFKNPNGFATGGVSGISIILFNIFGSIFPSITAATYMLIINVLLIIIGLIFLGKECGSLTIYCSLMLSFETRLFEIIAPLNNSTLTDYPLLELVYAVLLTGIGSAIIFKCKASSGGTDIVALILKKQTSMNVGTALLCTDFLIAASTFFVAQGEIRFDAQTGLFSLLGLFAKVFVVDDIIDSINLCKAFTIITSKPEAIEDFIKNEIGHSATTYKAEGSYSHAEKRVILTVCRRSEAIRLRKKVYEIDPGAFMVITKTSEIMGKGFRDNLN